MTKSNDEIISEIKELLVTKIQPAVERHGGVINFKSFENGNLLLEMSGACAGCAASQITLRQGVERIIKSYIPEVLVVDSVDDLNSGVDPYYKKDTLDVINTKQI